MVGIIGNMRSISVGWVMVGNTSGSSNLMNRLVVGDMVGSSDFVDGRVVGDMVGSSDFMDW